METLIEDLLHAAGPVVGHALNALPAPTRRLVAEAHESGAWLELRIGLRNAEPSVLLVLCNAHGHVEELGRVDNLKH